jgi:beta-phosphoglucomutase
MIEMNGMKKLAVFDLDGTLFDTKKVNYSAYCKAIELCGLKADIDYRYYCDFCNGNHYKVFLPQIVPGITEQTMQMVHEAKKEVYNDYLCFARKNEHLFSMIELMREAYVVALVTTASRRNVIDILSKFGVEEKFDMIVTQEDVSKTKPDPQGFILAMERVGISAEQTIIFEDSKAGLEAAERSGADYVRVYGYN